jgi:8-oxo-dGTP diphosphatase
MSSTRTEPEPAIANPPDDEASFLAGYDPSAYERPSLAVDVVVLSVVERVLQVAVYKRASHPARGAFALPGGFVRVGESLDEAARRLLADKAGLEDVFLEQLYTFGSPDRDPRGHIVSVAYYALIDRGRFERLHRRTEARAGVLEVEWSGLTGGPVRVLGDGGEELPLAFDHADIVGMAVKRIRGKLDYSAIGYQLLRPAFALRELQEVHETVLGLPLNKDSFRRRMLATGDLEATGERERDVEHRPAELYRFVRRSAV